MIIKLYSSVYIIILLIDTSYFPFIDKTLDVVYNNFLTYRQDDDWTYHFEIIQVSDHVIH